ncbi:MAG: M50 family metallopeptidase [bacterium]|nr:M50 family metallopeptidase [bacterium]
MLLTIAIIAIGIVVTAALITFLVTIHEFGHFLTAKFFGVKVEEFGIGFPFPGRLWKKKFGETEYSIGTLPAGGFVRLFGEEEEENKPRSFSSKPAWQRAVIIVAGVFVNFVFAFVLFTALLGFSGWKTQIPQLFGVNHFPFGSQENQVLVVDVEKDSGADTAGIEAGDIILSVNEKKIESIEELRGGTNASKGQALNLTLENSQTEEKRQAQVTPRYNEEEKRWLIGVAPSELTVLSYPSLAEKIFVGPLHSANMLQYQYEVMKNLFSTSVKEGNATPITQNVSGVVGVGGVITQLIQVLGFGAAVPLLTVMALLSLLLAIINVLPIPAVDGGRLFFVLVELVTRKKVNATVERWVHTAGFGILIVLFVLITFNDILKFF